MCVAKLVLAALFVETPAVLALCVATGHRMLLPPFFYISLPSGTVLEVHAYAPMAVHFPCFQMVGAQAALALV